MQNHTFNLPNFRPKLTHLKSQVQAPVGGTVNYGEYQHQQQKLIKWKNVNSVPSIVHPAPDQIQIPFVQESLYGPPMGYEQNQRRHSYLQNQTYQQKVWHYEKKNFFKKMERWGHPQIQDQIQDVKTSNYEVDTREEIPSTEENEKRKKEKEKKLSREQRLLKLRGRSFTRTSFRPSNHHSWIGTKPTFLHLNDAHKISSTYGGTPQTLETNMLERVSRMWKKFLNHKKSVIVTAQDVSKEITVPEWQAYQILVSYSTFFNQINEFEFECKSVREVEEQRKRVPYLGLYDDVIQEFSQDLDIHVQKLTLDSDPDLSIRKVMTDQLTYAVDASNSFEIDDSISVKSGMNGDLIVYVHIADASRVLASEDEIFRAASSRGSSIYLPDENVPMLPSKLGLDRLSLSSKNDNDVMTFEAKINSEGEVKEFDIYPSRIGPVMKLTYEEMNSKLQNNPVDDVYLLLKAAKARLHLRLRNGGYQNKSISSGIRLNEEKKVEVKLEDYQSHSHTIVQELMILANEVCGRFGRENKIPMPYRGTTKKQPEKVSVDKVETTCGLFSSYETFKQRLIAPESNITRSPAKVSPTPLFHTSLGVEFYVQSTSPLRRFTDLLVHHQLKSYLRGKPMLSWNEIQEFLVKADKQHWKISQLQKSANDFFMKKYFHEHQLEEFEGLVLTKESNVNAMEGVACIFLLQTGYRLQAPLEKEMLNTIEVGDIVQLRCALANEQDVAFKISK